MASELGYLKYSGLTYVRPAHHADLEAPPYACSCGRTFKTQKGRSNHFHNANNRKRRMGV